MSKSTQNKIIVGLLVAIAIMIGVNVFCFVTYRPQAKQTQAEVSEEKEKKEKEAAEEEEEEEDEEELVEEEETVAVDENADYILEDSSNRYYSKEELSSLTKEQLAIARNEIYARHGYIFQKNQKMKEYFEKKSWYKGTIKSSDFKDSMLNQYEKANVELIVELEK